MVMILTACCVWRLALAAASISPKAIISYPDSVKRLEAYLAAGDSQRTSHSSGLTSPARLGITPADRAGPGNEERGPPEAGYGLTVSGSLPEAPSL